MIKVQPQWKLMNCVSGTEPVHMLNLKFNGGYMDEWSANNSLLIQAQEQ